MSTAARKARKRAGIKHERRARAGVRVPHPAAWPVKRPGLGLISGAEVMARILARPSH